MDAGLVVDKNPPVNAVYPWLLRGRLGPEAGAHGHAQVDAEAQRWRAAHSHAGDSRLHDERRHGARLTGAATDGDVACLMGFLFKSCPRQLLTLLVSILDLDEIT